MTKISFFNQPKKILIIGFGRMGKLLAKIILNNTSSQVFVLSQTQRSSKNKRLFFLSNWKNLPTAELIIPCVPISAFKSCVEQIAKHIKFPTICLDICSVKTYPVKVMGKIFPPYIKILASHPMFGPDSYKVNHGLKNLKLVLHNINTQQKDYESLKVFFKSLGLKIIEMNPSKHDLYMANSLGLSYLVGKINNKLGIKKTPIDTYNFGLLLENAQIVANDSQQLFLDMQKFNPYSRQVRNKFLKTASYLINKLNRQS